MDGSVTRRRAAASGIDAHVALRVRARRMELGLSQADLACHLEISYQQVQKYERATNRLSAGRLKQLADLLDVPVAYFYDGLGVAESLRSRLAIDKDVARLARRLQRLSPDVRSTLLRMLETLEKARGLEPSGSVQ